MDIATAVAASRVIAQQRALEVTATNVANINTPGFRAARVQFSDWLSRQANVAAPPGGRVVSYTQDRATWRDQRAGPVTHTSNPFDLSLSGDGWFTVNTPRGPRLTRDGRFGPTPDGMVADTNGNPLLDISGRPIQLSPNDTRITIAGDGTVSSENGQLGKIGVVRPTDPMQMSAEGATLFVSKSPTEPVANPGITQGAVEDSNVQPVPELTRMLTEQREFEFAVQFLQAESDRQQSAIDKILAPGR
jgi:flagellar basal-body rod protein FlgF